MKRYWSKLGSYIILILATALFSWVADFVWLVVEAALSFSPLTEGILGFLFRLLICAAVVLYFASKDGYDKRTVSIKVNFLSGGLFVVLHGVLTLLISRAGPLGVALAELIYYGNEVAYVEVDPVPPVLCLIGVIVTDILFYIPMMTVGNYLGARQHQDEIQQLKEDHERRTP